MSEIWPVKDLFIERTVYFLEGFPYHPEESINGFEEITYSSEGSVLDGGLALNLKECLIISKKRQTGLGKQLCTATEAYIFSKGWLVAYASSGICRSFKFSSPS